MAEKVDRVMGRGENEALIGEQPGPIASDVSILLISPNGDDRLKFTVHDPIVE